MKTLYAATFLLGLAAVSSVRAETLALAETGAGYRETFAGRAPVSGRMLTGLAYGGSASAFETSLVRLALGSERGGDFICVRVQSQDGLYWSENTYVLPRRGDAAPGLAIDTAYHRELADYLTTQIGIRAMMAKDCSGNSGALVPALPSAAVDLSRLTFQLNVSGRRPAARLIDGTGAEIAAAACQTIDGGTAVAFNYACDIALPPSLADGAYGLEVALRGITGARTVEHFGVMIERAGLHGL